MDVLITKSLPQGNIMAPPSKSYAHRYLIASMLANNSCTIKNIYLSADVLATINCIKSLGYKVIIENDSVTIHHSTTLNDNLLLDCNESGSTLRFLIPIVLTKYKNVTFKGSSRLIERGIDIYEKLFDEVGIKVTKRNDSITFDGLLTSGSYTINGNISSQYITGLLFALPLLKNDSTLNIIPPIYSKPYIDITLDVLNKFKIKYQIIDNTIKIFGNQKYIACDNIVEGDYSNAAFLDAFNYLNGNINILNLNENSYQGDIKYKDYFKMLNESNVTIDISDNIDLGPVLFAFASLKHGATFKGTKRLKIKESDRGLSMKEELAKVGVELVINDDEIIVNKNIINKPSSSFNSHNDHRIAMALSLFSSQFDIVIKNAEVINKSYPNYFDDLESLGVKINYETR